MIYLLEKSVCIPVLGELMTNIIMTRVNFIFEVKSQSITETGLLQKGGTFSTSVSNQEIHFIEYHLEYG